MLYRIRIVLTVLMLIGCSVSGYFLMRSTFFNLTEIRVDYKETSDYVISLNDRVLETLDTYKQKSIWKLNLTEIENALKEQAWIQDVVISRQLPGTLKVFVTPKNIIANLVRSPTKIIPVAEDSQLLPITNHHKAPDVPLLMGREFLRNQSLRESALQLLKELPVEGSLSAQTVSEILPRKNEFEIRVRGTSAYVLMNTENVPVKAARASKVIDYLNERDMDGRVIDTNFSKKVLVKLRNGR